MANMACNWVQAPDLIKKLKAAGVLAPAVLHNRFGEERAFDNVLDLFKCLPEDSEEVTEQNLYPVIVDTDNQLHYMTRYIPWDEPAWRISRLLKEDVINCMTMVECEDEKPDMWQFINGEDVSSEEFDLEHTTIAVVQTKEVNSSAYD